MRPHVEALVGALVFQFGELDADFTVSAGTGSCFEDEVGAFAFVEVSDWEMRIVLAEETDYSPFPFVSFILVCAFH